PLPAEPGPRRVAADRIAGNLVSAKVRLQDKAPEISIGREARRPPVLKALLARPGRLNRYDLELHLWRRIICSSRRRRRYDLGIYRGGDQQRKSRTTQLSSEHAHQPSAIHSRMP